MHRVAPGDAVTGRNDACNVRSQPLDSLPEPCFIPGSVEVKPPVTEIMIQYRRCTADVRNDPRMRRLPPTSPGPGLSRRTTLGSLLPDKSTHLHKKHFPLAIATAALLFLLAPVAALTPDAGTVTISILYDNTVAAAGCRSDWGFSCLIEGLEKTILFDTGTQSEIFFHNAETMKKDLSKVDLVVISHDHSDHTGSLSEFLKRYGRPKLPVYLPRSAPRKMVDAVSGAGARVLNSGEPVVVCRDAQLTGELTQRVAEQALILNTAGGLIVVTGCAHPGIVEILERTRELRKEPIRLVLGGFHLMEHKAPEIEKIISRFQALGVQSVGATHCTGDEAIAMMRRAYGQNFVELGAGRVIAR